VRSDRERFLDILEAIERIEHYTPRGRTAFLSDELLQTWAIHHIQIIGEAASRVSDSIKTVHPEIPWAEIVAMRHILVHDYFLVDPEEVWATVERDLPGLKQRIITILRHIS